MKIALGSDLMGFSTKEYLKKDLTERGHEVLDLGTLSLDKPIDHISAADRVSAAVLSGDCRFGILLCRTGMGISIAANKHPGIHCALCESALTAREARRINNCNVLAIGGGIVDQETAVQIAAAFLKTGFAEGESEERKALLERNLSKLAQLEERTFRQKTG